MKLSGWITLIVSWTAVIGLLSYCFSKVLAQKGFNGDDEE